MPPDQRPIFADEVDTMLMAERETPAYTMGVSCTTCGVEMHPEPVITAASAVQWQCPMCRVVIEVRIR